MKVRPRSENQAAILHRPPTGKLRRCQPRSAEVLTLLTLVATMDPDSNNPTVQPVHRSFRERWSSPPKIILGIDVGTTHSSVGFTYVYPGVELMLHRVNKWPGQEGQNSRGKVPSVVWYNLEGEAMSFGAEALTPEIRDDAEDNGWQLAKHFKLHLHPPSLRSKHKITIEGELG
ncbi:unnamed protein product [Rhizoctonia solani]|uniref:Uncharacterized protein n=1 Tax=Rhizoctonia solani TaxID=456999 RepID=A0A8H3BUF7_9AGAM|nr:unnamed protein product [Rhizoctonia solani]